VPIAVQAARHLKKEIPNVVAALRPGSEKLAELLRAEGCEVTLCANADEGMGASLACAVRAAGAADGYLVALADMPFVRPTSIGAVRDALAGGARIAAPYFRTRRGHPIGISGTFFDRLIELGGDEGARGILAAHEAEVVKVPVGDPGVIRDIDQPGDLAPPIVV
jgi:molybdenum cofactor cytidylyltransferase